MAPGEMRIWIKTHGRELQAKREFSKQDTNQDATPLAVPFISFKGSPVFGGGVGRPIGYCHNAGR